MKFSNETLQLLKNYSTINPSIMFKPGKTISTLSPAKSVFAISSVNEEFESPFAIYDLSRFLASISLFSDPEFEFHDNFVMIREGRRKIRFTFTEPGLIVTPPDKEITLPNSEVSFTIKADEMSEVMKAMGVLGLPEISISGDGSNVFMKAIDAKNESGDSYMMEVGETTDEFDLYISSENLKILPLDYTVEASSNGFTKFENPRVTYYIATEQNSRYGTE